MVEHFFLQFGAGAAGDALGAEVGLYLGGGCDVRLAGEAGGREYGLAAQVANDFNRIWG